MIREKEAVLEAQTSRYLNEFEEVARLGKGGYGKVYKVYRVYKDKVSADLNVVYVFCEMRHTLSAFKIRVSKIWPMKP